MHNDYPYSFQGLDSSTIAGRRLKDNCNNYQPTLSEICRKCIRDTIYQKNKYANMYKNIPLLGLPKIVTNQLLFYV